MILFNVHDWGCVLCALGSALTWIVYLLCSRVGCSVYSANFFSEVVAAVYSEGMGRWRKCPGHVLSGHFQHSAAARRRHLLHDEYWPFGRRAGSAAKGTGDGGIAGSLAVGILLVSTVFRAVNARRRRAPVSGRE